MYMASRPVIHERIGKDEVDVTLILKRVGNEAFLDALLDLFEVHGLVHDILIIGGVRLFDGIVEDVTVSVLRDRGVYEADPILEPLQGSEVVATQLRWVCAGSAAVVDGA
jgi:hypothetical protein